MSNYVTEEDLQKTLHTQLEENIRYPEIEVQLIGINGNAFNIIGAVKQGLKEHKVDADEIKLFTEQAMSGDYTNVLFTALSWVTVY